LGGSNFASEMRDTPLLLVILQLNILMKTTIQYLISN
jgi:hypothetical protein